jgi:hypothetical protein
VAHQRCADTLSLELIDHTESQFGPFGTANNVAAATNDGWHHSG